jgi:hypothetical protein
MTLVDRFHLLAGPVEIHFPSEMTVEDVTDFEAQLALIIRGVRRRAVRSTTEGPTTNEPLAQTGG